MNNIVKVGLWIPSFIATAFFAVAMTQLELIKLLFILPTDLWDRMFSEEYEEEGIDM